MDPISYQINTDKRSKNSFRSTLPFEILFDKAPFGLFVVDEHGCVADCNEVFLTMAGSDYATVLGFDLMRAQDQSLVPYLRQALAGVSVDFETKYTSTTGRRTGDYRYIFHPLQDEQGRRSVLCFIEEVSRRKQAERALQDAKDQLEAQVVQRTSDLAAAEARFRGLVEQSLAGFYIFDETRLTYANPELARMLGHPDTSRLVGRPVLDWVAPADQARVRNNIERRLRGDVPELRYRYTAVRSDGRLIEVETHGRVSMIDGQRCIIGVMVDITEQVKAQSQLIERERTHRHALVREVHHRIKNHLQGVVSLLDVHAQRHATLASAFDDAKQQVQAIAVVHGLHAHHSAAHLDLAALIQAVCQNQEQASRCAIAWQSPTTARPPENINPEKAVSIALTLNELIQNALKHRVPADTLVRVDWHPVPDGAVIRVSNRIDPEETPPRIDVAGQVGLGLGLEIIRSLLPHQGAHLDYHTGDGWVHAQLRLGAPVVRATPANPEFSPHEQNPDR